MSPQKPSLTIVEVEDGHDAATLAQQLGNVLKKNVVVLSFARVSSKAPEFYRDLFCKISSPFVVWRFRSDLMSSLQMGLKQLSSRPVFTLFLEDSPSQPSQAVSTQDPMFSAWRMIVEAEIKHTLEKPGVISELPPGCHVQLPHSGQHTSKFIHFHRMRGDQCFINGCARAIAALLPEGVDGIVAIGKPALALCTSIATIFQEKTKKVLAKECYYYCPEEGKWHKVLNIDLQGKKVAVVLDVLCTGGSREWITRYLEDAGTSVVSTYSIIDRRTTVGGDNENYTALCQYPLFAKKCSCPAALRVDPFTFVLEPPPEGYEYVSSNAVIQENSVAKQFWNAVKKQSALIPHYTSQNHRHYFMYIDTARLLQDTTFSKHALTELANWLPQRAEHHLLYPDNLAAEEIASRLFRARPELKLVKFERAASVELKGMTTIVDDCANTGETVVELIATAVKSGASAVNAAVVFDRLPPNMRGLIASQLRGHQGMFTAVVGMPIPHFIETGGPPECPLCQRLNHLKRELNETFSPYAKRYIEDRMLKLQPATSDEHPQPFTVRSGRYMYAKYLPSGNKKIQVVVNNIHDGEPKIGWEEVFWYERRELGYSDLVDRLSTLLAQRRDNTLAEEILLAFLRVRKYDRIAEVKKEVLKRLYKNKPDFLIYLLSRLRREDNDVWLKVKGNAEKAIESVLFGRTWWEIKKALLSLVEQQCAVAVEGTSDTLVFASQEMEAAVKEVVDCARDWPNQPILLLGSSGSGKDVLARLYHVSNEKRRNARFIKADAGSTHEHPLIRRLMGWKKGSFTPGTYGDPGYMRRAAGGTVFLDEIDKACRQDDTAATLLNVVQYRRIEPLGEEPLVVDVSIVASATEDLLDIAKKSGNRAIEELDNRFHKIKIPSLSSRGQDDILVLTKYFLQECERRRRDPLTEEKHLSEEAANKLLDYDWQVEGVHGLRDAVHAAWYSCRGREILASDIKFPRNQGPRRFPDISQDSGDARYANQIGRIITGLDDRDKRILTTLLRGKTPTRTISKILNVSSTTVEKRIRALKKQKLVKQTNSPFQLTELGYDVAQVVAQPQS